MIGTGTLLRLLGKGGARVFDRLGVLPPRWFLMQALRALSEDDLPMVMRCLTRVRGRRSKRWELIRQQAVFRCRLLKEKHQLTLKRLANLKDSGFLTKTKADQVKRAMDLHRLAIRILASYESYLQSLAR